jgi:predicted transcriptional regulator
MVYEYLVLHVLKNNESATAEQITKWLKADWYKFANGNKTRVALKRLRDRGLVVRNDNGTFSITSKGLEHYENLNMKILGELSPTEKQLFEFLQIENKDGFAPYPLKRIARELGIPYKRCLNATMRLACKRKALLWFKRKYKDYLISLSFTEYEKLRRCVQA